MSTSDYSIDNVYKTFSNVMDKSNNGMINLPEFIIAFQELTKFFGYLNRVFLFVARDLDDKFHILGNLCRTNSTNYRTVQSMIEHESSHADKVGVIALLRLLRALEFIYLFLKQGIISPVDSSTSKHIAWDVYKQTLHKRHNRATRLVIWCATATLPTHDELKQNLLHGETEPNTADKCFPLIEDVYRNIHRLYEENNLLELVRL